jgi:UDP-N-acetylmuramate dehydrogenase
MPGKGDIVTSLSGIEGLTLSEGVLLSELTTWKVGGPADLLVKAGNVAAVTETVRAARAAGAPLLVLGRGSNLLVSDEGFRGLVLCLEGELAAVHPEAGSIEAGGGAALFEVVRLAAASSLSGMEYAFGIPGSVGGAVMTNAGTFAGDTRAVLKSVSAIGPEAEGVSFEQFEDVYRTSLVPPGHVITSATFVLERGDAAAIKRTMEEVKARRAAQPRGATAGSVFKNPPGDSAGRLLEVCGLRGSAAGGAMVSPEHANFIVNQGDATAGDIFALMARMIEVVEERRGVKLEPEVRLLGFDKEL